MEQLPQTQPQTNKYKFILNLENPILSNLNYEEKTSRDSFSNTPPTSRRADKDIYFYKTIETLSKSGEQRNPKDIRILMKSTENFQYFLRLKENPATSVLHSRFCRVMKLKHLRKGDTLFYAGHFCITYYLFDQKNRGYR